jgi:hypothetical protein
MIEIHRSRLLKNFDAKTAPQLATKFGELRALSDAMTHQLTQRQPNIQPLMGCH